MNISWQSLLQFGTGVDVPQYLGSILVDCLAVN